MQESTGKPVVVDDSSSPSGKPNRLREQLMVSSTPVSWDI